MNPSRSSTNCLIIKNTKSYYNFNFIRLANVSVRYNGRKKIYIVLVKTETEMIHIYLSSALSIKFQS
jgi:hypothetical protein